MPQAARRVRRGCLRFKTEATPLAGLSKKAPGRWSMTRYKRSVHSPSRTPFLVPSPGTFPSAMDSSVHGSSKVADRSHIQF
jgi:hypothetical protein